MEDWLVDVGGAAGLIGPPGPDYRSTRAPKPSRTEKRRARARERVREHVREHGHLRDDLAAWCPLAHLSDLAGQRRYTSTQYGQREWRRLTRRTLRLAPRGLRPLIAEQMLRRRPRFQCAVGLGAPTRDELREGRSIWSNKRVNYTVAVRRRRPEPSVEHQTTIMFIEAKFKPCAVIAME